MHPQPLSCTLNPFHAPSTPFMHPQPLSCTLNPFHALNTDAQKIDYQDAEQSVICRDKDKHSVKGPTITRHYSYIHN
jgi:hypothetical protein